MTTTTRTSPNDQGEDLGAVAVRISISISVSSRAGRLLFALLLYPPSIAGMELSTLAGIPRKTLPACIDELISAAQEQPSDPEYAVDTTPMSVGVSEESIPHTEHSEHSPTYLDPEDKVAEACRLADQAGDTKAQALALVDAWKLFFPEVNKVQELQPRKAKEWIKLVGAAFPGKESTTVFGWMSGVDEKKLLALDFPLAYVNKMIVNKAAEVPAIAPAPDQEGIPDEWRQYAQKIIEQGASNHVGQKQQGNLQRIARAVKGGTGAP